MMDLSRSTLAVGIRLWGKLLLFPIVSILNGQLLHVLGRNTEFHAMPHAVEGSGANLSGRFCLMRLCNLPPSRHIVCHSIASRLRLPHLITLTQG